MGFPFFASLLWTTYLRTIQDKFEITSKLPETKFSFLKGGVLTTTVWKVPFRCVR